MSDPSPPSPSPSAGPGPGPSPAPAPAERPPRTPKLEDFPETGPNALGSLSARAYARIVDTIIVDLPFLLVLFVLTAATLDPDGQPTAATEELTRVLPLWFVVGTVALAIAYEVIATATTGQTIGKWVFGLRVAGYTNGKKPTWEQAALRCLLPTVAAVVALAVLQVSTVGAMVVLASAFFHPLRRGWHDQAGGTIVVRTR